MVRVHLERVGRLVLVAVVLVALALFAFNVRWSETWSAVRTASPAILAAAAAVNLLSLGIKAVRWWIFLGPIGAASFRLALRATFAGAALNNILIANSGEAARVILVSRIAHLPSENVLATLAMDRLFELMGYFILLTLSVSLFALPPALDALRPVAFVALVGAVVLLAYLLRHPERADLPVLEGEGLLHRARRYGRGFLRALRQLSTGPRFAVSLVLSLAAWGLQVATYQLTARAATFDLSLVGTIAAILAVNVGFAARATPGNFGLFQAMYAMTALAFGMDKDAAIGVALLIQMQQVLPVTIIGLATTPEILALRRRHAERPSNVLPGEPEPSHG